MEAGVSPWLDGPTALAMVGERAAGLTLATTVTLPTLRGPVAVAKFRPTLALLHGGPVVAGLGPGSSVRDYDAVGLAFDERWPRFEEAVVCCSSFSGAATYITTPEGFAANLAFLREQLVERERPAEGFPQALVTMWTWVTEDRADAERVLTEVLAPLLGRDPETLRGRVCIGPAAMCAELLAAYDDADCARVHFWPLRDERRQVELIADQVVPRT